MKLSKWKEKIINIAKESEDYERFDDLKNLLIIHFKEKTIHRTSKKLSLAFIKNSEKYFNIRKYISSELIKYYEDTK